MTKHIETYHHSLREKTQLNEIDFIYCNINDNITRYLPSLEEKLKLEYVETS